MLPARCTSTLRARSKQRAAGAWITSVSTSSTINLNTFNIHYAPNRCVQSIQGGFAMQGPLANLEQWEDFVKDRYDPERKKEEFRQYDDAPAGVREFYRLNHASQTRAFVQAK